MSALKRTSRRWAAGAFGGLLMLGFVICVVVVESLGPWAMIGAPNARRPLRDLDGRPDIFALDTPVRRGLAQPLRLKVGPPAAEIAVWVLDPPRLPATAERSKRR